MRAAVKVLTAVIVLAELCACAAGAPAQGDAALPALRARTGAQAHKSGRAGIR